MTANHPVLEIWQRLCAFLYNKLAFSTLCPLNPSCHAEDVSLIETNWSLYVAKTAGRANFSGPHLIAEF